MTNLKITISSRKQGHETTYPVLIPSLLAAGVPARDIYFFIGGYDRVHGYITKEGVNCIEVDQNSIDYTGLIAVLDLNIQADYWFLMHDTCKVGPNFYSCIMNYKYDNIPAISLNKELSMNMGAYSWDYLQAIKAELTYFRNTDFSEESIRKWKDIGITCEDKFLEGYRKQYHFDPANRIVGSPIDFYGTGVERVVEYFQNIDLYKIKANGWIPRNNVWELRV